MMKECLRHQIVPFIIDDKRRGEYHKGIINWNEDPSVLSNLTLRAQGHFEGKMDVCKLLDYCRPEEGRGSRKGKTGNSTK